MPGTRTTVPCHSCQVGCWLVRLLAVLLSGVRKCPSTSRVAALCTPFPELTILALDLGFALLRGNVLPVGLLLLEFLLPVWSLIRLGNMGLVLGAFRVSGKVSTLSTCMASLVSLGELGLALFVLNLIQVLHQSHDIGLCASLVSIGVVDSSSIKARWSCFGINWILGCWPFLTVVGLVVLGFQLL